MLLVASLSVAQDAPQAFVNARIIPIEGPVVERGVLVVQDAKIIAVGPASSVQVPSGAERHDLGGKTIMPGLVDTHSHIGGGSGGDRSAPIQPDVRILDAIDVRNTGLRRAQAGGITTVNVMPGSGHLLSGQTLYLKLRTGRTIDDLLIRDEQGHVAGGLKMANGTNSIRTPPFPGTRAKSAALVREAFVKAIDYRDKLKRAGDDPEKRPARDLGLETLMEVLDGRRVVHFHTHRHDDILTVIRLSEEFGFKPVLQHVSEGWKVADEIAKAGLACSVIVLDSPGGKIEAKDVSLTTGAVLDKAGVLVGFHTDDYITDSRLFLRSAALAVRAGMAREKSLSALTMAGARMLGLEQRVGSLEPGKDADFIVLSGDPLSVYTHIEQTWIEGQKVFDREDPEDRLYAVGGYGASRDGDVHVELGEETR
ncbi:MAG: amidohydrolase family protein [Luteitalea sp.]|nr:amidohydrolase family protein [Luteitalea sp.]